MYACLVHTKKANRHADITTGWKKIQPNKSQPIACMQPFLFFPPTPQTTKGSKTNITGRDGLPWRKASSLIPETARDGHYCQNSAGENRPRFTHTRDRRGKHARHPSWLVVNWLLCLEIRACAPDGTNYAVRRQEVDSTSEQIVLQPAHCLLNYQPFTINV